MRLPVAMGMSRTPEQCDELDAVWRSLDQREIIRPAFAVRLNMALWFASVQFLIFSWICRQRRNDAGRTGRVRWILCLVAGVARGAARPLAVRPVAAARPASRTAPALPLAQLRRGGRGVDPDRDGLRRPGAPGRRGRGQAAAPGDSAGWSGSPRSAGLDRAPVAPDLDDPRPRADPLGGPGDRGHAPRPLTPAWSRRSAGPPGSARSSAPSPGDGDLAPGGPPGAEPADPGRGTADA